MGVEPNNHGWRKKISDGDANYSKSCGYMVEVCVHIIYMLYIYDIYIRYGVYI